MKFKAVALDIGYRQKNNPIRVSRDIHFSAQPGELVGIVGINGVGKSTLLRTLAGLLPPLSGDVLLDEERIFSLPGTQRSKLVSVVLTDPVATKNVSVAELVAMGRQPYTNWLGTLSEEDLARVQDVIKLLDLSPFRNRKCYELSDGQFQRVLIGRALAQDTPIILLDEPTMHLDLFHKVQVLKLLQTICQNTQKLIMFTSHELNLAIQLCSKILIMGAERHAFDTPKELIRENKFNTLFPQGHVQFDSQTGAFKIASL